MWTKFMFGYYSLSSLVLDTSDDIDQSVELVDNHVPERQMRWEGNHYFRGISGTNRLKRYLKVIMKLRE